MVRAKVLLTGLVSMGLLVALGCKNGSGSSSDSKGPLSVPMVYRPTNTPSGLMNMPTGNPKIFITPVTDSRSMTDHIGQSSDRNPPLMIVAGQGSPALFVSDGMKTELGRNGLTCVDSAEAADKQLNITITRFEANESGNFKGAVMLTVKVADKSGKELVTKTVSGDDQTYGNTMNPENYQQVLSNSLLQCAVNLLASPDFVKAISK